MSQRLTNLKEKLADQVDELTLVDILGITAEEICDRFEDKIEDKINQLEKEFGDEDESLLSE